MPGVTGGWGFLKSMQPGQYLSHLHAALRVQTQCHQWHHCPPKGLPLWALCDHPGAPEQHISKGCARVPKAIGSIVSCRQAPVQIGEMPRMPRILLQ